MDYFISRSTSIVAKFRIPIESCEVSTSQNKALINAFHMSAPLADDVQTSLGAGLRCKGTTNFAYLQMHKDFFRKIRYTLVYIKKKV